MKKNLLLITIALQLGQIYAQNARVSFGIKDYPDTVAYIGYHFGNQKYLLDTLEVSDDQFALEVDNVRQGVYFIYSPQYFLEFIMENKSFELVTSRTGGYQELEVKGSRENEIFKDFQLSMSDLQRKQRAAMEQLKTATKEDSLTIRSEAQALGDEMDAYRQQLIETNAGTFMASFLQLMNTVKLPDTVEVMTDADRNAYAYQYVMEHYFDQVDLADPRLLRTPLLHAKVIEYFDRVVVQHPDSIKQALDTFFMEIGDEKELFRYWLVTLFKKYADSKIMGMDAVVVHLARNYYLTDRADWVSEEYEKQLKEEVAYLEHNLIGKSAPPLNVVDTLLQPFDLRQVQAPYTLLFIYDPDCGHCKKAVKTMEEHDQDLYDLDIQVLAVCTTTDVERWREFVGEHNPMWAHAIDPTGKSYFRVYYNVRSTPQVYLLDAQKQIIAKKLEIDQVIDLVKRREGRL